MARRTCSAMTPISPLAAPTAMNEKFGREAVVLGFAATPRTTVDVHKDRRVGRFGRIEIEPFDRRRSVGEPLRGAKPGARLIAAGGKSLLDLADQRRIDALIVGGIELDLVHFHPHQRPFVMLGRSDRT